MKEKRSKKMDIMWKYVIFAYLLFWVMVFALGGTAAMVLEVSPLQQRMVEAFCAWAPTFAFLIMFKKLRPDSTIMSFVKDQFKHKLRLDLMLLSGMTIIAGSLLPVVILSFMNGQEVASYFSLKGYPVQVAVILSLFAGPLGEELGWRGYLRVELDKKYSFLKASVLGGVIWAFWHAVLWFIDAVIMGGSTGWELIIFIVSNVVVMTSIVIVMNVIMAKSNNLFNAIWIHFCFNIVYVSLINIDIWYFVILTVFYLIIGTVFAMYHLNCAKKSRKELLL